MIDFYFAGQTFFENNSGWLTFISFLMALLKPLTSKLYRSLTRKPLKNSWFSSVPLILMLGISSSILFFLINSEKTLDPAMVSIIAANTVVVVFLILVFLLGDQKINAVHFAKAKHGLFDINYLDE